MSSGRSTGKSRLRLVCIVVIALLYVLSVPWYRGAEEPLRLWLGLPDWVAVALLCYVAVAILNGVAWLLTDIPDETEVAEGAESASGAEAPR